VQSGTKTVPGVVGWEPMIANLSTEAAWTDKMRADAT
jgi:hypothetical protein